MMQWTLPRKIWVILLLGFSSGLPLALTTSTLSAWYTEAGLSLMSLGMLNLVGQPYIYKFIWAPLIDRYDPLKIGRRKSWMLLTQTGLFISLLMMGTLNPSTHPVGLAVLAGLIALFSATQDIAISAYLVEAAEDAERGLASGFYQGGYRIACIVAGALALVLAQYYGWRITYVSMALLMGIGFVATALTPEPPKAIQTPRSLKSAVLDPFREFLKRFGWKFSLLILLVLMLYKLTDAFALALNTVFYLRELHYSLSALGLVTKIFGTIASLLGILVAAFWMKRIPLFTALVLFGLIQTFGNLAFLWLYFGAHTNLNMGITVFIDNFASGMGSTAFLAFIISLCAKEFAGTQLALLSAIAAMGRVYIGPAAAWVIASWGWASFYWVSIAIGLAGVASLYMLRRRCFSEAKISASLTPPPSPSADTAALS